MDFRESGAIQSLIALFFSLFSLRRMVKDAVVWVSCVPLSRISMNPSHKLELPEPRWLSMPLLPESTVRLTSSWANTALAYGQPAPYGVCKRRKCSDGHVLKGILGLNRKRAQRKVTVTSPVLWSGGRCSVPGKPVSPSQCVHKHHRARWLKRESFIFFGSRLTCWILFSQNFKKEATWLGSLQPDG